MFIESIFRQFFHIWCQNWCQYLWTSLCQFNFFVNLLHSLGVSFFDIWHLFDNLTSFWYFHTFNLNHLSPHRAIFFYGSWIRACTGSFGDVPKYFGLHKEVGYIAKWWVFTKITFLGSNFFRAVIRACTGSFANVYPGTSPLYIKVGQISGLSKDGSWDLVDACNFFFLIY